MTRFIATGMRTHIHTNGRELVVNTCSFNDTGEFGDLTHWGWANPTNRRFPVEVNGIRAVSTECLWQGTKIFQQGGSPDQLALQGDWRRGKRKRPIGAWDGTTLLTSPGAARRAIYVPAYVSQIDAWSKTPEWADLMREVQTYETCYMRDFDTGQGIDRNGPMSHAWLLGEILNGG